MFAASGRQQQALQESGRGPLLSKPAPEPFGIGHAL
jgi:hypothetical protein